MFFVSADAGGLWHLCGNGSSIVGNGKVVIAKGCGAGGGDEGSLVKPKVFMTNKLDDCNQQIE